MVTKFCISQFELLRALVALIFDPKQKKAPNRFDNSHHYALLILTRNPNHQLQRLKTRVSRSPTVLAMEKCPRATVSSGDL